MHRFRLRRVSRYAQVPFKTGVTVFQSVSLIVLGVDVTALQLLPEKRFNLLYVFCGWLSPDSGCGLMNALMRIWVP
jgi:hypothetical protein